MAADGANSDSTLMKVAIFGICMSLICTAMFSVMLSTGGDYDYDEIDSYRDDLIAFSGESMINQTPWVLTHVYTPWTSDLDASTHTDADGWLYGSEITDYSYLKKSADIKLSPNQKSAVPLTYTEERATYTVEDGYEWWSYKSGSVVGWVLSPFTWVGEKAGLLDPVAYKDVTANAWNYTGYRYVFDPTLPFKSTSTDDAKTSTVDGALSLVWYSYNGQEGLSGGLDVYGGEILLASYSAMDIIADYNDASGYATTYDFDFSGTHLVLSIRFDANALEDGTPLMQAWQDGDWSMAISSVSAGNFFDLENSTAFTATAGSMIETFISIYTFSMPSIDNPWMDVILWLIVGLPMTMAMLFITLRVMNSIKIIG
jgi:hypothetical protein